MKQRFRNLWNSKYVKRLKINGVDMLRVFCADPEVISWTAARKAVLCSVVVTLVNLAALRPLVSRLYSESHGLGDWLESGSTAVHR